MALEIKRLHKNATFKKAHIEDEGYDVTACDYTYKGTGLWYIHLGIAIKPPKNIYFELITRSSFCKTPFIFPGYIGIIDRTYRGEVLFPIRHLVAPFWNEDSKNIIINGYSMPLTKVKKKIVDDINSILLNKRIAQLVPRPIYDLGEPVEVDNLTETVRGINGLGSTGG